MFASAGERFNVAAAMDCTDESVNPQLDCVTPLRLLLASEKDPKRWRAEVKDMESHNAKRSEQPEWKKNHVNVVQYLRSRCKLDRYVYGEVSWLSL